MIRWQAPGPYVVAFTTRLGGVSSGAFESLNLGLLTEDNAAHVVENRRRACAAIGADAGAASMAWQHHSAQVCRATSRGITTPGTEFERCDALWSDAPGEAMLLLSADCLPIAVARASGDKPALVVLHAGWRGLLIGIVQTAVSVLGGGRLAAAIGPGIGPCCYEVRADVAEPFRERFGAEVARGGKLDLWGAADRALRDAGCEAIERTDLCTFCHPELFFSHRRDEGRTGRQGVVGYVA